MKCPLFVLGRIVSPGPTRPQETDCIKEECAWWEPNDGQCSVRVLAQFIAGMGSNIQAIKAKMPHEGQFRELRR